MDNFASSSYYPENKGIFNIIFMDTFIDEKLLLINFLFFCETFVVSRSLMKVSMEMLLTLHIELLHQSFLIDAKNRC